jgi:CRISPR/Cas system-associated exonuclease Cas4 (RecB family)
VQQQLQIYAIATRDALGLEPLKATAHFLYANQAHKSIEIPLEEAMEESMKQQISNTVSSIKAGVFPMCAFSVKKCHSCDFKGICSGSQRG